MKTIYLKFTIIIILLCVLTSCSNAKHEINIDNLMDESGHYVYDNLAWGTSTAEAGVKLGITIENPSIVGKDTEHYSNIDSAIITINGNKYIGQIDTLFDNKGLVNISFMFKLPADEAKEALDILYNDLANKYGDAEQSNLNTGGVERYGWICKEGTIVTSLAIGEHPLRGDESVKYIGLNIGITYLKDADNNST